MFYLDTSVMAAYYCPEPLSEKAEEFIVTHSDLAISHLTELELYSAIARKIREGNLNKGDGSRIIAKFSAHRKKGFYLVLPITPDHYRLAREWIAQFSTPLRSLDALHLAVTSLSDSILVTADEKLSRSAQQFSLQAHLMVP